MDPEDQKSDDGAEEAQDQYDAGQPIVVETHRDLRRHMRAICRRLNSQPEIARLLLVNATFAFEDIGVVLSEEMRRHVRQSLSRPPRLVAEEKEALEELLREHGKVLGKKVPKTPEKRARLLFETLGIEALEAADRKGLDRKQLARYADKHPLVARLVRYEQAARGGLIMHTRGSYEKFKSGQRRHRWVKAVHFKV